MTKEELIKNVEDIRPFCHSVSRQLWLNPEISGQEKQSAALLRNALADEGFKIVIDKQLDTAFYAEYGSGYPVIAILAEYDALAGLSQKCQVEKEPVKAGAAGHGCGHNLLGTASTGAAIVIKRFLEQTGCKGTVRLYGCPEEETLCGKVKMINHNMFDGCDAAISWHPMSVNMVHNDSYLANASMHFTFRGKSAHAAFAPHMGRSALDAVELMNVGCNYLREHIIDSARIHYTTDSCGCPPNIVPDFAKSWYYVRAPYMSDVKDIVRRIKLVAQGAAMMTETEVEINVDSGCCEMLRNTAFADVIYGNMSVIHQEKFTKEEIEFARVLAMTLDKQVWEKEHNLYQIDRSIEDGVLDRHTCEKIKINSSSDSGDVSQIMPMGLFTTACWPVGCAPHTWQTTASAGSTIGEKGMMYAAKIIAATAYDLFTDPEKLKVITEEFQNNKKLYQPMCQ